MAGAQPQFRLFKYSSSSRPVQLFRISLRSSSDRNFLLLVSTVVNWAANMLHFLHLFAASLCLVFGSALPQISSSSDDGVVVTVTSTLTATVVPSTSTTSTSTSSHANPITQPTSWLTITAARSGSAIHLLPMNAGGFRFWLGGSTISLCPESVQTMNACPVSQPDH